MNQEPESQGSAAPANKQARLKTMRQNLPQQLTASTNTAPPPPLSHLVAIAESSSFHNLTQSNSTSFYSRNFTSHTLEMARGNQRDKAREANQKKLAGQVRIPQRRNAIYAARTIAGLELY